MEQAIENPPVTADSQAEIQSLREQLVILRIICDSHIFVIQDTEKERDEWKQRTKMAVDFHENPDNILSGFYTSHPEAVSWFKSAEGKDDE